jgi:hypothetical protein
LWKSEIYLNSNIPRHNPPIHITWH